MSSVIEICHLTKRYGKQRGVSDVSFTVEQGDIFGFLGPNGAGKSTTIRSLLGLIHYQSGQLRVLGYDAKKEHTHIMQQVGYLPSETWFYPNVTVNDILKLAAEARRCDCSEERQFLCDKLQLDMHRKISDLSLGNRKKVGIVCAMQHRPRLYIFDEPTSGLDPLIQSIFFDLIHKHVEEGATCLLSTHVLSEVRDHCNRVAIMKDGRLLCCNSVAHLTRGHSKRIRMIRDGIKLDYLYHGSLDDLYKELEGHHIGDILIEEPSIEEIFMHYYGGEGTDVDAF
ncbi:MAG: ABC transporter ATP-binding protein [Eubacteriales bacterium]|nr:ABC transporter ATP-binding protein [Eubacteriales bacterium]